MAIAASRTMLMPGSWSSPAARVITLLSTPAARRRSPASRARMAVPSMPTPPVRMMALPGRIPDDRVSAPFRTSPSIVPTTMGRSMPRVTSVWPPISVTPISAQASRVCNMISCGSVVGEPSGRMTVMTSQRGVPPIAAMSLAFTCAAYQPSSAVANVTGSELTTR